MPYRVIHNTSASVTAPTHLVLPLGRFLDSMAPIVRQSHKAVSCALQAALVAFCEVNGLDREEVCGGLGFEIDGLQCAMLQFAAQCTHLHEYN